MCSSDLEKKQRIIAAADKLFNRFGIQKTGMDEIARLSRVARGTLYNYFGSKEGLLDELLREKLLQFETLLNRTLTSLRDPVDRLRSALRERINITVSTPVLLTRSLSADEDIISTLYSELDKRSRASISPIIDSLYESGISSAEKDSLLNTLIYTVRGLELSLRDKGEAPSPDRLEDDINNMVGMIMSKKYAAR